MTRPVSTHINVACAVIERGPLVLAAQRSGKMSMPLKWEFPGGKIHGNESSEECLVRELMEELNVRVAIKSSLTPVTCDYKDFIVTLHPFVCEITAGDIVLHEHRAIKWLLPTELFSLEWPEADIPVIEEYLARSGNKAR